MGPKTKEDTWGEFPSKAKKARVQTKGSKKISPFRKKWLERRAANKGKSLFPRRRLAAAPELASDSSFSLLWAPLLLIFLALAYLVMRRVTAPRRPKNYGKFVKHGSRQVPAWRQAHESNDLYDIVIE